MLLLVSAMSIVTVNLTVQRPDPWDRILLWNGPETFGVLAFGLLLTVLCATIGVMVSLRSETVRQANLRLSMGLIVFFPALGFVVGGLWALLPSATQTIALETMSLWDPMTVMGIAAAVLCAIDAALLFAASRMFVRSKLILD
jgi:ABC-2 type transport system permease protein